MTDSFPRRRLRRNRHDSSMRRMVRETKLTVDDLIQPIFIKSDLEEPEEISGMEGQYQHTIASAVEMMQRCETKGIPGVILFGIPSEKDSRGSSSSKSDGIIQRTLREADKETADISLIADVCLCEYTDHGHCGIVENQEVANDPTLDRLSETAVSVAKAGADVVAPSDMMDGRVGSIRQSLDDQQFQNTPIMSYAVKYRSNFYGPFREAAESSPDFGDRKTYQMDPANRREARVEARMDVQEGADWLMVKPALPYLDIIREIRDRFELPLAAYCVSGEFGMIESASNQGRIDRKGAILETLTSIKRAGADSILTYWAEEVADWIA